jgi:hypothetical protein
VSAYLGQSKVQSPDRKAAIEAALVASRSACHRRSQPTHRSSSPSSEREHPANVQPIARSGYVADKRTSMDTKRVPQTYLATRAGSQSRRGSRDLVRTAVSPQSMSDSRQWGRERCSAPGRRASMQRADADQR